jgi:hypothetical protein
LVGQCSRLWHQISWLKHCWWQYGDDLIEMKTTDGSAIWVSDKKRVK